MDKFIDNLKERLRREEFYIGQSKYDYSPNPSKASVYIESLYKKLYIQIIDEESLLVEAILDEYTEITPNTIKEILQKSRLLSNQYSLTQYLPKKPRYKIKQHRLLVNLDWNGSFIFREIKDITLFPTVYRSLYLVLNHYLGIIQVVYKIERPEPSLIEFEVDTGRVLYEDKIDRLLSKYETFENISDSLLPIIDWSDIQLGYLPTQYSTGIYISGILHNDNLPIPEYSKKDSFNIPSGVFKNRITMSYGSGTSYTLFSSYNPSLPSVIIYKQPGKVPEEVSYLVNNILPHHTGR